MNKKFFSVRDGALCFEFEGTDQELAAKFDADKEAVRKDCLKSIEKFEAKKKTFVRPENFASLSPARQEAVDANLKAQIAQEDMKISEANETIKKLDDMKISDEEFFVLEAVKIEV